MSFSSRRPTSLAFVCQTATLIICKPQPSGTELLSQDSILFAQILDGMLLLLVHPPGDRNDYEPEWI